MRDSRLPYILSQTLMNTGNAMGTMDMTPTTKLKKPDPLWPSAFTCVRARRAGGKHGGKHARKRGRQLLEAFPRLRASLGTRLEQQRDKEEGAEVELRDGVHEVQAFVRERAYAKVGQQHHESEQEAHHDCTHGCMRASASVRQGGRSHPAGTID